MAIEYRDGGAWFSTLCQKLFTSKEAPSLKDSVENGNRVALWIRMKGLQPTARNMSAAIEDLVSKGLLELDQDRLRSERITNTAAEIVATQEERNLFEAEMESLPLDELERRASRWGGAEDDNRNQLFGTCGGHAYLKIPGSVLNQLTTRWDMGAAARGMSRRVGSRCHPRAGRMTISDYLAQLHQTWHRKVFARIRRTRIEFYDDAGRFLEQQSPRTFAPLTDDERSRLVGNMLRSESHDAH